MGAYAEMAVRTGAHRAMRHGHATALTDANIDLVTVRGSGYTCDLCAPWVGKVLSLTGKTPTGKQRLQHVLHDGVTVEVDVAGTVEQARDAGLFHPNCGHNYAAFFPGLTTLDETPEDDGTYAASQHQRKLEHEIRALKRELAVTNQKTDVQRLRAGVRSRQKQIRQLQQQYPALTRKYHREQPSYDLPIKHHQLGQRIATQPKTVTSPANRAVHDSTLRKPRTFEELQTSYASGVSAKPGKITIHPTANPDKHEKVTADTLTHYGIDVHFRKISLAKGDKNPDVDMLGEIWEFKAPKGDGKRTIDNQFKAAESQAENLVLDTFRTPLSLESVVTAVSESLTRRKIAKVIVITKEKELLFRSASCQFERVGGCCASCFLSAWLGLCGADGDAAFEALLSSALLFVDFCGQGFGGFAGACHEQVLVAQDFAGKFGGVGLFVDAGQLAFLAG